MLNRIMKDENGVLTFEWILLITILVIGIIGGIAAIRDALIIESAETAGAIVALNQSYKVSGEYTITVEPGDVDEGTVTVSATFVETTGTPSEFVDEAGTVTVAAAGDGGNGGETPTPEPEPEPEPGP